MGSPADEEGRSDFEGPQVKVRVSPFWMGTHEVAWKEYSQYMDSLDMRARNLAEGSSRSEQDPWSDAVSRPTPPYVPMDFDMGVDGYPAISMTQFAAKQYTKWLDARVVWYGTPPAGASNEFIIFHDKLSGAQKFKLIMLQG